MALVKVATKIGTQQQQEGEMTDVASQVIEKNTEPISRVSS